MNEEGGGVLPYRTGGEPLAKFVTHRARGRTMSQVQAIGFSRKNFEGTVTAATELGLLEPESNDLTDAGQEFALAPSGDRKRILLRQILEYAPYELLLDAVFSRDEDSTELDWVETWWSTAGFGNSESNRSEGSTTFAKLIDYIGLGKYVKGRRGYPTRIEWTDDAEEQVKSARQGEKPIQLAGEKGESQLGTSGTAVSSPPPPAMAESPTTVGEPSQAASSDRIHLNLPLGEGRVAELMLPPVVTPSEKERLLTVVESLLTVEAREASAEDEEELDGGRPE